MPPAETVIELSVADIEAAINTPAMKATFGYTETVTLKVKRIQEMERGATYDQRNESMHNGTQSLLLRIDVVR